MKNLSIKSIATFFACLIMFVSSAQYQSSTNTKNSTKEFNKYERILTDKEIIQLGIDHNDALAMLMAENPKNLTDISNRAMTLYAEKGLNNELLESHLENTEYMNAQFLTNLINENKESFVNSDVLIKKILEADKIEGMKELKKHELETRKILEGVDLDTYLTLSVVSQYSLDFWSNKFPDAPVKKISDWKRADGISAAIGFLTTAAVIATVSAVGVATGGTGVVPTLAILGSLLGIGISSALSSLVSLLD